MENAKSRLKQYAPAGRPNEELLVSGLRASLDLFPEPGTINLARDILQCDDDNVLHEHFQYLYYSLFVPSEFAYYLS